MPQQRLPPLAVVVWEECIDGTYGVQCICIVPNDVIKSVDDR